MIKIICVGKVKEKYLRDAISDYEKRISKYYKIDIIEVNDSNMKEEAIKIKQHIKSNDYVITLEIEGNMLTSIELANKIDKIFKMSMLDFKKVCQNIIKNKLSHSIVQEYTGEKGKNSYGDEVDYLAYNMKSSKKDLTLISFTGISSTPSEVNTLM